MDGFYEWRAEGKKKFPIHFRVDDGALFAMAGLWEFWTDGTNKLATCCLITTDANAVVAPYHDRMPVIIPSERYDACLDHDTPERELRSMLAAYPPERTRAWIHQNRRLRIRYDRRADIHQALLTLACIKVCGSILFGGYC